MISISIQSSSRISISSRVRSIGRSSRISIGCCVGVNKTTTLVSS
jgi:hypothetical protein